ncbi:MAG: DMSO reductase anchor subunit [Cryomorphaceae bacterium]|jgi:DMSO reductase anchor subunit
MKPAISVLIFTVSSGAGYGLLMWMFVLHMLGQQAIDLTELFVVGLIGLCLVTLGLLASTLHLANPKNAWRAFSRFRTSWLSREGVFAVAFYPIFLGYVLMLFVSDGELSWLAMGIGVIGLLIAIATVICTGMIYASLKPIRQWHNPLTTPIYMLFSLMSGSLLLLLIKLVLQGELSIIVAQIFMLCLVLSLIAKVVYFVLIGKPDGSTINTATGFSQAQVRLLDAGHNAGTFLTKEFVFDAGAVRLLRLRRIMFVVAFALPVVFIGLAYYYGPHEISYLSLVAVFAGLLIERWLFFAEARHVVRLYHGDQRT